jgi:Sec-independent protein translocase protein TatA
MFGSLAMPELIVIFVIALIVFGPRKLPEWPLARQRYRGIQESHERTTKFVGRGNQA